MKRIFSAIASLFLLGAWASHGINVGLPGLIIDTDLVTDASDVGAIQVGIALHKTSEIKLIGVVSNSSDLKSAACAFTILNLNGLSSIPVGAYMGNDMPSTSTYTSQVVTRFDPNPSDTRANYTDATTQLRTVLAAQPNNSVIYASIGFGVNLSGLLQSAADGISPLTGAQLFAAKVTKLVIMGGDYPNSSGLGGGSEYNFHNSPVAWNYVFANKPGVPTYLWGFTPPNTVNIGSAQNGGALVSPSYYAFTLEGTNQGGGVFTRPGWDAFAVLYAVRGLVSGGVTLFNVAGANGQNSVNSSTGANTWVSTAGADSYLGKTASDGTIQTAINNLIASIL
jgi:inosine-uridine nucleoside N-ribohydrolase